MELLYIWIEEYKNIKEQGFNFSSKHRFEFIPEKNKEGKIIGGKLHHEENRNHIENFFGENITNVTAIIGENGAGKSSLLEALIDILPDYIHYEWQYLIVFLNDGLLNIQSSFGKINTPKYIEDTTIYHLNEIYHIFYKEILDTNDESVRFQMYKSGYFIDLSIANALFKVNYMSNVYKELDKQIDFVINSDIKQNYIFQYPHIFGLNENISISTLLAKGKESLDINDYIRTFTAQRHEELGYRIKVFVLRRKGYSYQKIFTMSKKQLDKAFLQIYSNQRSDIIKIFKILTDKSNYQANDYLPRYSIKKDKEKIKELYNLLKKTELHEYFIFGWSWERSPIVGGMSSGELKLLTLFSKFYSIKKDIENAKNIVILIDEGELGFHPQWQKEYLKILIDFLPQIFPDKKIQIILTSHSPFLVSDLPKENIVFLSKNDKGECAVSKLQDRKETFGANIHTLFTDSFFMKGGLMGTFAQKRIDEVIAYLNGEELEGSLFKGKTQTEQQELAQKYISIIGEPIIKNMLQKQLNTKRLEKVESHEKRIKKLEEELEVLKKAGKTEL